MKRQMLQLSEEEMVLRAIWEHMSPKLVFSDVPILKEVLANVFSGVPLTLGTPDILHNAIAASLSARNIEVCHIR